MIVMPDAPVKAVNSAHATSETIANPPGSQPSSACDSRTNRAGACPALNKKPANVKSGIATRTGVSDNPKNSIATTDRSTPSRSKPTRAPAAITANSGAPSSTTTIAAITISTLTALAPRKPRRRAIA